MTQEDEPVGEAMTILACDPPQRLVLSWTGQEHWEVELDRSTDDGRTVLRCTQVLRSGEDVGDIATGWHWYLDKLEAEVTGSSQPADWDAFLAEVGPAYARRPEPCPLRVCAPEPGRLIGWATVERRHGPRLPQPITRPGLIGRGQRRAQLGATPHG